MPHLYYRLCIVIVYYVLRWAMRRKPRKEA